MIRAIDSNISNCPVSRKSHEIYTRVRCLVINQHDRESSINWRFKLHRHVIILEEIKKFIFLTSKQVLSATRNILNLSGNKGICILRVTSRRKDIVQKMFCGKMYVHAFFTRCDTFDLDVMLVYHGSSCRTFVSRCRKGRNDRISVPSSCSTHCSLIKTVTLYLLAACLARALHKHISSLIEVSTLCILLDNNVQACRVLSL